MPADNTMPAAGSTLKTGTTIIANVVEIGDLGGEMGERSTDDLSSTIKMNRPTVPDLGTLDFSIHYKPTDTTHQALLTAYYAKTESTWTLTYVDGGHHTFDGWIKKFASKVGGLEDTITADVSIRVTSVPAYTAGP